MKNDKFSRKWKLGAVATMLASLSLGVVAGCGDNGDGSSSVAPPTKGLGVFYFDAGSDEYQLSLADGNKVTFIANGESKTGTYTSAGSVVTFKFDGESGETTATIDGDVLSWTYNNEQMRFFKKVFYTVSYDEQGGEAIEDVQVVNGKTVSKPDDPVREGYQFLGWYADSEYQTPFMFDTQIVISDITLYAKWAMVTPGTVPFTVDFDLGYEADEDEIPAPMETIGGKIYNVPTPSRDGYKFCGWWISMYEDGEKLTCKYTADTVFEANTTLFAVWESENLGSKLAAPFAEVTEAGITWNGIEGVTMYRLKVLGPGGYEVDTVVSKTTYDANFASAPAGDYSIEVTALASNPDNNSETIKRSFINKAVGRVSQFSVLDGKILLFNRVENAEVYYVTIYCGSDAHEHVMYNNGDSTYYSFANCDMDKDGIRFTVTAAADGFASVTSETYVYIRSLDKVEGVTVDEETQMVTWYPVKDATNYIVSVSCGDASHEHEFVNVGSRTSFSLKECSAVKGGDIIINVYAQTKGYNSSEPTQYSYNKTKLASPSGISAKHEAGYKGEDDKKEYYAKTILSWNAVAPIVDGEVVKYSVKINGRTYGDPIEGTTLDITDMVDWMPKEVYSIEIKAITETNESVWSNAFDIRYMEDVSIKVYYKQGVISWDPVIGAAEYEVVVNGGETITVSNGVTSMPIEFTEEGSYSVSVRAIDNDASFQSSWVTYTIDNILPIVFDGRGATSEIPTMYKVTGDIIELPVPTRAGYEFVGWYNTPKGPESNGAKYESGIFTETNEIVLYAYWKDATYKIHYAGVNGTYPGQMEAESGYAVYTQNYKLDVPTVADGKQVFLGWFIGDEQLTDDRGYSLKPWNFTKGDTVTAKYVSDVLDFEFQKEAGFYAVKGGLNIKKVSTVTIPATYEGLPVKMIGYRAFASCTRLVVLNVPDTMEVVDSATAFEGCMRLQEVNVYHVEDEDFATNNPLFTSHEGVLIGYNTFNSHYELSYYPQAKTGSYVIPDIVTSIPLGTFGEKKVIDEITIPTSVTSIASYAFRNCKSLKKINFVEGGTDALQIEAGAFQNCTGLQNIKLPARLAEIQMNEETHTIDIFDGCTALTHVNVEYGSASYASVDGVITDQRGRTIIYCPVARDGSYTIPEEIEAIGDYAFVGCKFLTEIVVHGNVETIGKNAFEGCSKIVRVRFNGGALAGSSTVIGEGAFANTTSLKSVIFEEGSAVTQIGAYAFSGASALREFTIPTTMTKIGDYAFENAESLATVAFEDGEEGALSFGSYVFSGCVGLMTVTLPKSVTELNLGVFDGCVNISAVEVDENNANYMDIEGVVFSKDGTEILFFPKGKTGDKDGKYVIPESVTKISEGAFKGMFNVKEVVIGAAVTEIGNYAFKDSIALSKVTFAENTDGAALAIGDEAFMGCGNITEFDMPARTQSIGAKAFYGVSIKEIAFGDALTSIGDFAFSRTAIEAVEITANAALGTNVFDTCTKLTKVTFAKGYQGTAIPVGTFKNTAITAIEIPASVELIGDGAFIGCSKLTTLTFEDGGTADLVIGAANLFDGINTISAEGVFANCEALGTVAIPDRVTIIGTQAFMNCPNLNITINKTSKLERVGHSAFRNCASLSNFYIPATVKNTPYENGMPQEPGIGDFAFSGTALSKIEFAMGGTDELSIGVSAFAGCGGIIGYEEDKMGNKIPIQAYMESITLPNRIAPIYTKSTDNTVGMFDGIGERVFSGAFSTPLSAITIEEGGKYYGTKDNVLYSLADVGGEYVFSKLMMIPAKLAGKVTIPYTVAVIGNGAYVTQLSGQGKVQELFFEETPDGVEPVALTINQSAFSGVSSLTKANFPERLMKIADYAFQSTKLTSIALPASLEYLGASAFKSVSSATSVTFAKGIKIKEIPNSAFEGCSNKSFTALEIPASVEKIGLTAFKGCSSVASLTFEEGCNVTKIEGDAFQGMSQVTTLQLPEGLTTLSGRVFYNMSGVTTLILPSTFSDFSHESNDQVRFLFQGMTKLSAVEISEDNPKFKSVDGVIYSKDGSELVYYPKAKAFTNGAFVTPENVASIASYAFYERTDLKKLTVSADLTSIGPNAFNGCSYLTSIVFEDRIDQLSISDKAFLGCKRLNGTSEKQADGTTKNVFKIPAKVNLDGMGVFYSCFNNSYSKNVCVVFEDKNVTSKLNQTFYSCSGIISVENIPSNLSVMTSTFISCTNLAKVTFADVEKGKIENMYGTFKGCTKITSIELPFVSAMMSGNSLTSGQWDPSSGLNGTFQGCTGLTSVKIQGCNVIGYSAFTGCSKLAELVISSPDSLVQIYDGAFYGCSALEKFEIPDSVAAIGYKAFMNSGITSVVIPDYITTIEDSTFEGCSKLTSVKLGEGVMNIGARAFYGLKDISEIVFPESLNSIGDYAFYGWSSLQAIDLPASVQSVGEYAFANCYKVKTITAADGMLTIGDFAFQNAQLVESFNIPATIIDLGIGVFDGWTSLTTLTANGSLDFAFKNGVLYNSNYTKILYVSASTEGQFVVPDSITSLAENLFANTKITSVILPDTIREIPARAFMNCSALVSVKMPANLVKIGDQAFYGCTSLKEITIPKTVHSVYGKVYEPNPQDPNMPGFYVSEAYDGIGHAAFMDCTSLENVIFEEGGVQRLSFGDYAFYGCTSLKGAKDEATGEYTFAIPSRVRGAAFHPQAGRYAVWNPNMNQYDVYGGEDTKRSEQGVGMFAFANCTSLTNVVFEESDMLQGEPLMVLLGAFQGCKNLQSVTFSSALANVEDTIGGGKGAMTYKVAPIGENAFAGCGMLTTVTFPKDTSKFYVPASAFAATSVKLEGITVTDGADYQGSGKDGWYSNSSTQYFNINGTRYCNPWEGIFLNDDPFFDKK